MFKSLFMVLALLPARHAHAEGLSRDAYLAQVRLGNRAYKAMEGTETALKLAALEPDTLLSPYLSAGINYYNDESEQPISFQPQRTTVTDWGLSLSKQLDLTGTRVSLGYKGTNSDFALPNFVTGQLGDIYFGQNAYTVGLVQPLLKDFGARGHAILKRKALASTDSARLMNQYAAAAQLFEAETAYVSLAAARQVALLLEESLERNRKILEWTKEKYVDNLVDKVDVLQVEAALRQVESGLNAARQELKSSGEKFNTLRGEASDKEIGDLQALEAAGTALAPLPAPSLERLDLQAALRTSQGNEAAADELRERYMPDLSVIAQASGTGGDAPPPSGKGESFYPDHGAFVVGLKLTSILDLSLYHKVMRGADIAISTGKDDLAQKKLKADLDWKTLQSQWESLQAQLKLARELEDIQKEKAEREKKRYQDGRTTNFQVLRFDEDYAQARISTLRLAAQAAILMAQANFYNGGGIQW
jgi:outer membrane protein TolC